MIGSIAVLVPTLLAMLLIAVLLSSLAIAIRDALQPKHTFKAPRRRPHITFMILQAGDTVRAQACVESIRASRYARYDIVLIGNGLGVNGAVRLAKSNQKVYYFRTRKRYAHHDLIAQAFKRSEKGDIAVVLRSPVSFSRKDILSIVDKRGMVAAGNRLRLIHGTRSSGFYGVLTTLGEATAHFMADAWQLISKPSSGRLGDYVISPALLRQHRSAISGSNVLSLGLDPAKSDPIAVSKIGLGRRLAWITSTVLAATIFYILAVGAINGETLEAFVYSWVLTICLVLAVTLFDKHLDPAKKRDVLLCGSFVPVLVLLVFVNTAKHGRFAKS